MIHDHLLALLAVPLAPAGSAARFAGTPAHRWRSALAGWVRRTAAADPAFGFTLETAGAADRLRVDRPFTATADLVVVTDPAAELRLDPRPPEEDHVTVVLACCAEWPGEPPSVRPAGPVLFVEPRWAAAILVEDRPPLFWGVSAAETEPSVLGAAPA